jgi:hypothetical protein
MALTQQEIERARYHLGYPEAGQVASLQYGIPIPIQTLFLFESAVNYVLPVAEQRVRQILLVMDNIEVQMSGPAVARLAAIQLGDLKLRENEPDLLEGEYRRWGYRLAETLGVPVYAYSTKYRMGAGGVGAGSAGSIPVRH